MTRPLHPEEIAERKVAWQRIWRERFLDQACTLPANVQGTVHELLKAAFKAGTTWERKRHEPESLGGVD